MLLIVFLYLNTNWKPFVNRALNSLETLSLISSMVTIYCGLFFISDTEEQHINISVSQLVLTENVKMLFFVVIVSVNVFFFFYWGYKMYQEMK